MNSEFIEALKALEKEKGISKAMLLDAIEAAMTTAFKRNYNGSGNVRVVIDSDNGDVSVFSIKRVVEYCDNPADEIELEDALKIAPYYQLGDILEVETKPDGFGRIAAQAAKQVVVQRIREAERGMIYDEYAEKENEVLTAVVQHEDRAGVQLEMGKTEGFLAASEYIPGESFTVGSRLKVYVLEVRKTSKVPQIMVSRTHPGLIKRLFEFEVPEIQQGIVLIKSIAREAGSRSKLAVYSADSHVDPVGACVGQRGQRVERIVAEINNEKVDVIEWSSDPVVFIANSLSPARVLMVQANEEEKTAKIIVPDSQLSLAIGKEGQNARLAAKLTGWKIDIKSQSQLAEAMKDEEEAEEYKTLDSQEQVNEEAPAAQYVDEQGRPVYYDEATGQYYQQSEE